MHFEDSYNRNLETTKADAGSVIFLIVISLFTLGVLISSFASWRQKKLIEQKQERRRLKLAQKASVSADSLNDQLTKSPVYLDNDALDAVKA